MSVSALQLWKSQSSIFFPLPRLLANLWWNTNYFLTCPTSLPFLYLCSYRRWGMAIGDGIDGSNSMFSVIQLSEFCRCCPAFCCWLLSLVPCSCVANKKFLVPILASRASSEVVPVSSAYAACVITNDQGVLILSTICFHFFLPGIWIDLSCLFSPCLCCCILFWFSSVSTMTVASK